MHVWVLLQRSLIATSSAHWPTSAYTYYWLSVIIVIIVMWNCENPIRRFLPQRCWSQKFEHLKTPGPHFWHHSMRVSLTGGIFWLMLWKDTVHMVVYTWVHASHYMRLYPIIYSRIRMWAVGHRHELDGSRKLWLLQIKIHHTCAQDVKRNR